MTNKKVFSIAVAGLSAIEVRMLKSLCLVSGSRVRSYALAAEERADGADLWIVDGHSRDAMAALHALRAKRPVPVALVGCADPGLRAVHVLPRPLVASRVLNMLDLMVTSDIGYVPELVIGGTGSAVATGLDTPLKAALSSPARSRHHTALVVDDSPTIRKQIELALRLHEVEAVCVETGEAALEALGTQTFDLIFLDVVLPGDTDGYHICRTIKRNRAHKGTPVIMLTGKSSTFDRVRGSLAGCDTYLTKPVENGTFSDVLKRYLRSSDKTSSAESSGLRLGLQG